MGPLGLYVCLRLHAYMCVYVRALVCVYLRTKPIVNIIFSSIMIYLLVLYLWALKQTDTMCVVQMSTTAIFSGPKFIVIKQIAYV